MRIYGSGDDDEREAAAPLLRMIADHRVLKWIPEFLSDASEGVQNWGIGVLDQLVYCDLIEHADAEPILRLALSHQSEYVRQRAVEISSALDRKAARPG